MVVCLTVVITRKDFTTVVTTCQHTAEGPVTVMNGVEMVKLWEYP